MIVLDSKKCSSCGICTKICSVNAIERGNISGGCIYCGQCVAVCPEGALSYENRKTPKLKKLTLKPEALENLFKHNRSCRHYLDKPVPEEVIQEMLQSVSYFPSGGNRRRVELTVFDKQEYVGQLNKHVGSILLERFSKLNNSLLKFLLRLTGQGRLTKVIAAYDRYLHSRKKLRDDFVCFGAPALFVIHCKNIRTSSNQTDAAIWASNLYNLAAACGLGTCYIGFIPEALNLKKEYRRRYGIPADHQVVTAFTLGYPRYEFQREVYRRPAKAAFYKG